MKKDVEEFTKDLVKLLNERTKDLSINVVCREITKINDVKYNSLNLLSPDKNLSHNFYIESMYRNYEEGMSIDSIVEKILEFSHEGTEEIEGDCISTVSNIYDYNKIKDRVIAKLINFEKNKEYLQDKCYVRYLDFAVCFYVMVGKPTNGMSTLAIPKCVAEKWNKTNDELLELALENMQLRLPAKIESMSKILGEMMADSMGVELDENAIEALEEVNEQMYVLSNEPRINGATTILYKDVIKDFANKFDVKEVYIIPASIHELILLPATDELDKGVDDFNRMIKEVNETMVDASEILSEHVYMYDKKNDSICYF